MTESQKSCFLNHKEKSDEHSKPVDFSEDAADHESTQNVDEASDSDKNTVKRQNLEANSDQDSLKRHKSENSEPSVFLDIIKSVVNEDSSDTDKFNVLTNTKEYDCPIAKLARMKPGDGFLKASKTDDSSTNSDSVFETNEADEEKENKEPGEVFLEPSMSDNEKLLQEIKECKLSVYKDSEWSDPVPVVTHLILNKDSSHKRVVCFQFGTGRLLLNTVLLPSMSFNKLKSKSIIFSGQTLGENSSMVPHRLVFTDSSTRDEFHDLYSK